MDKKPAEHECAGCQRLESGPTVPARNGSNVCPQCPARKVPQEGDRHER